MKVNFLIVGTQKGGSTALAKFLSGHPEVSMANKKEVHFFDNDELFSTSRPDYDKYHNYFSENYSDNSKAIGEATPSYMYWNSAAKRIHEYNPNMKLIFILRNPIERAYSHYIMVKRRKLERLPFSLAIRLEKLRCANSSPKRHRLYSYIDRGFYAKQIRNMLRYFSMDKMLFLKTEDLKEKHEETLHRVYEFLSVAEIDHTEHKIIFSNKYSMMEPSDRKFLQKTFRKEIEEIEGLLGWDCYSWR